MADDIEQLWAGLKAGNRSQLARAITLVESDALQQASQKQALIKHAHAEPKHALVVGLSGAPGVGKSTLIEALGLYLCAQGHKVGVLAIDPSSPVSKGSLLGDRTRMPKLSKELSAFIRPSPSRGMLGGVAPATSEVIRLLDAAGFDIIIVETVGVGQSEVAVRAMVDAFLLLISPASGDELQGAKKGIVELADVVAVTKWDGDLKARAESTRLAYMHALQKRTPVMLVSALSGEGLQKLWQQVSTVAQSQR